MGHPWSLWGPVGEGRRHSRGQECGCARQRGVGYVDGSYVSVVTVTRYHYRVRRQHTCTSSGLEIYDTPLRPWSALSRRYDTMTFLAPLGDILGTRGHG